MSSTVNEAAVLKALAEFKDPETGRDVVGQGQVHRVKIDGSALEVALGLTTYSAVLHDETRTQCEALLRAAFPQLSSIKVNVVGHDRPPEKIGAMGLPVKNVIAVGSGKGGVGKSTIAASLAYGLHRAGSKVGLMDADVYGPSIPHLLGISGRPEVHDQRIQPLELDGMKVVSIGFLVPPDQAVVWRGPMLHQVMNNFTSGTDWGPLDYLIVDMPPGTGDIALSLSQLLPLTGAVVVCTPQDVALLDAVKAIAMFGKVNIPILGMVENMSYFLCPDNGKRYEIFGSGGAKKKAIEMNIPFLGEVPINIALRERGDEGQIAGNFTDETTRPFLEALCYRLVKNLAESRRESPPLPSLSIL